MHRRPFSADRIRPEVWLLLGALVVAAGALEATLLAMTSMRLLLVVASAAGFFVCLLLSGNPRLLCFYGLLLLAPIDLGKQFMVVGHQGGANSFIVHATDPFLVALLAFQARDFLQGYRRTYRIPAIALLWAVLMGLGVYTVVFGQYRLPALHEVVRMGKILVWVLVLNNEVVRKRHFIHAAVALSAGVALQATLAATQYFTGTQLGLEFVGEQAEEFVRNLDRTTLQGAGAVRRVGGLLGHPNLLGAYLALLVPTGVALLLTPIRPHLKLFFAGTVVLGSTAVVLTLSRGAWIGYGTALVSVLVLSYAHPRARSRYMLARAGVITIMVLVALAFSGQILARLYQSDPQSLLSRWELLRTAYRMILDQPVFGFGLNQYVFVYPPYSGGYVKMFETFGDSEFWPVVHNVWALTWAEQGTVGFVLFVALHVVVITVGVRNLKLRDPTLHALNVGLLSGFGAIMLDGLVSFFIRQPPGIMFWIVVALILAIGYWRRANEAPGSAPAGAGGRRSAAQPARERGWLPRRPSLVAPMEQR